MWAVLGDIEFEVLGSAAGWEQRFGGQFAEHERISGKALLQPVGGVLDEISWNIRLHHRVHDVQMRLRQIRNAAAAQEPLALVLGDGDYLGPWVIVDGTITARKTEPGGRMTSVELDITLREYAGEFVRPVSRIGLLGDLTQPGTLTRPLQAATLAQQIAGAARTAQSVLRSASELVSEARSVIQNPVAALARVPGVLAVVGQGLGASETMRSVGELLQDAGELVQLGRDISTDMGSIRAALVPPELETIGGQLNAAAGRLDRSAQRFNQARGAVMQMMAAVATRQR